MTRIVRDDVTGGVLTVIGQQHTQPFHIVQITFPNEEVYLSEGPAMTFEGHSFLEGRVLVGNPAWSADGNQTCSLEILNVGGYAASLFLTNKVADAQVRILKVYRDYAGTFSTPIEYVVGSCDDSELTPDAVKIGITTARGNTRYFPGTYMGSVGLNHMPVEGSVVFWNATTYVLEKDYG